MKRVIHNPVLNETVTFICTAAEPGGAFTELETVMPGASSPPHFHITYDETITALEGCIRLQLSKGAEVELAPGGAYLIKVGRVHGLCNATASIVRVRSHIAPGSQGFEDALHILYGLASDGLYSKHKMPRSLQAFAVGLAMSDTQLPGWMSIFNPLLVLVARFARWRGLEAQLHRNYCL